jgi:hypothetical protein
MGERKLSAASRFIVYLAPSATAICAAASWRHFFATQSVRLHPWPRDAVTSQLDAIAAAGLVLLGIACVVAHARAEGFDMRRVVVSAVLVHVMMLCALPLFSSDLFTYLAYGAIWANGMNPHLVGPAALGDSPLVVMANWPNSPSVYGPVVDIPFALSGWVGRVTGSPVWAAGITYKLWVGLLDFGSLALVYGVVRQRFRRDDTAAARGFALFALNPLVAWEVACEGHNDGILVAAAAAYLWALNRERSSLAVASLAFGTFAKLGLAPSIALHIWSVLRQSWKRAALLSGLVLALAVVAYAPIWSGPATLRAWLLPISQDADRIDHGFSLCTGLWKVLRARHASDASLATALQIYLWAGRAFLVAVGVTLLARIRSEQDVPSASLVLLFALFGTSTALLPWYLTWLLPFAAVERDARWRNLTVGVTAACAPVLGVEGMGALIAVAQVAILVAIGAWTLPPVQRRLQVAPLA